LRALNLEKRLVVIRLFGLVGLLSLVAIALMACGVSSESGGASEPVQEPANPTTEAGSSAISSAVLDAETCDGVLSPITGDLSLATESLTEIAITSQPQLISMCSAMYDTGLPDREFLVVALMEFKSDDSAIEHYDLMKAAYTETGAGMSELNNADESLIDQMSALIDDEGVGRTTILRQKAWLVSITVGPTMAQSLWNVGDIEAIGRSVLERAK
jgi:hypothetical protein